jgi:hypothetical protein
LRDSVQTRLLDFSIDMILPAATMAQPHPLTEICSRNLPGGKGRPARKADLTAIYEPIVSKMLDPRRLTTPWASTINYRDRFLFHYALSWPKVH